MNLCERIKKARKDKGLTQQQFAELMDVHINTIKKYETKLKSTNFERINQIAALLDVSPNWLAFGISDDEVKFKNEVNRIECRQKFLESLGFRIEYVQVNEKDYHTSINGVEYNDNELNFLTNSIVNLIENMNTLKKENNQ